MQIARIETSVLSIPFDGGGPPQLFGGRPWTHLDTLLVKVETDTGVVGWGEAFGHVSIPATRAALDRFVADMFLGRDPRNIAGIMDSAARTIHALGRNGPCIYALSGIDIALWDIAAKLAGLPLYRLLGGERAERLEAYASLFRFGDPALVARNVTAARAKGYRLIKLHEVTRDAVLAARSAGPDCEIMLDTNCPWTVEEATEIADAMRNDGLAWLEEPVWPPEDVDGLASVRSVGIPLAAGENAQGLQEFKALFTAAAIDVAQPSVTKIGGLTQMLKVVDLARSFGVRVVPHSPYLGPGFLATLHLIAAMPNPPPVEALWLKLDDHPFDVWTTMKDGYFSVPQVPGLGADYIESDLDRFRVDETITHDLDARRVRA